MTEIVLELPEWLKDIVLPILKSAGKQAAIALCEKYLPLPAICEPAIDSLIP